MTSVRSCLFSLSVYIVPPYVMFHLCVAFHGIVWYMYQYARWLHWFIKRTVVAHYQFVEWLDFNNYTRLDCQICSKFDDT